ncbi:PTS system mannose/fructose/sorbose family transporter subunit IID [Clostridium arbusti]|uniref:PTS system mannose/fructose/sorbose family transporter subunit IID n=1 Tax=Clostridium arbusti TaxID=1137848 RepID=UPI000288F79A|nr:mannose/fructose/sorbose PTS transporter subunit IID [Clostridium arbusti]
MANENNNEKKLTKADRVNMFIRSNLQQASFNYERIHGLGFCFDMVPAIKRLYATKEERIRALKAHLVFFNVTPGLVGPILGITAAMEETKANGTDIEESSINSLKVGLMGPLAGVGDPIMWGTLRPILAALGASMALTGSILGPLIFFIGFNAVRLALLWFGLDYGYKKGLDVVNDLAGNTLQKLTEGASILGLFVMGALVSKWTSINVPLVISSVKGPDGKMVVTTVQNMLDKSFIPGLLALALTLVCMRLLKKKISPILLIFALFAIGILGYWIGILK